MKKNNLWLKYTKEDQKKADEVCERYKSCLDRGKTERECVALAVEMAKERGYRELYSVIEKGEPVRAGDKLYAVQMDKSVALILTHTITAVSKNTSGLQSPWQSMA